MTLPYSPVEIEEVRQRAEKATPGPWTLTHKSGSNFAVQAFEIRGMLGDKPNIYPIFQRNTSAVDGGLIYTSPEDAAFIARARQDIPSLLATIEALQATVDTRGRVIDTQQASLIECGEKVRVLEATVAERDADIDENKRVIANADSYILQLRAQLASAERTALERAAVFVESDLSPELGREVAQAIRAMSKE